jgi:signal transduction histidine kinase
LQIRLSLARDRTEQTAPDVAPTFSGLIEEAEAVGEELRRIAHGISPPLLATRGLVDALGGACPSSRSKTRPSTPASLAVRLRRDGNELAFSVHDTGRGFDPRATARGAGLTGLKDRIGALGSSGRGPPVPLWRDLQAPVGRGSPRCT